MGKEALSKRWILSPDHGSKGRIKALGAELQAALKGAIQAGGHFSSCGGLQSASTWDRSKSE